MFSFGPGTTAPPGAARRIQGIALHHLIATRGGAPIRARRKRRNRDRDRGRLRRRGAPAVDHHLGKDKKKLVPLQRSTVVSGTCPFLAVRYRKRNFWTGSDRGHLICAILIDFTLVSLNIILPVVIALSSGHDQIELGYLRSHFRRFYYTKLFMQNSLKYLRDYLYLGVEKE